MNPNWNRRARTLAGVALLMAWAFGLPAAGADEASAEASGATNAPEERLRAIMEAHTNYLHILEGSPVHFVATGRVDATFSMAAEIAPDLELVGKLTQALVDYSACLRRSDGYQKYRFTNPEKDNVDLEVLNLMTDTNDYSMTTVATGERFFGAFEALIHMESRREPDGKIYFEVHLYGYPKSAMWRFVARNIAKVRRYFVDRVISVTGITARTYEAMARDPMKSIEIVEQYRDPRASLHFSQAEIDRVRDLLSRHAGLPEIRKRSAP